MVDGVGPAGRIVFPGGTTIISSAFNGGGATAA